MHRYALRRRSEPLSTPQLQALTAQGIEAVQRAVEKNECWGLSLRNEGEVVTLGTTEALGNADLFVGMRCDGVIG
jgi:hypothetical protein